jgi:sec-independent protein translocase protein TatB
MFDIGATELLLIAIVAILVIGPNDMPLALRTAGRWVGKMRKVSGHFRAGLDAMVREAELEDMEKKWQAQNEKIMREHPEGVPEGQTAEMEPAGALSPARQAALKEMAAKESEIIAAKEADAVAAEEAARGTSAESAATGKPSSVDADPDDTSSAGRIASEKGE